MLLEADVALAPLTTLKLGGRARFFVRARSEDEVAEALAWAGREGHSSFVLGGGSNVVVPDGGVDGLVIAVGGLLGRRGETTGDTELVHVAAGEPWDDLVAWSIASNLSGLECLSGIPGLVGATPIQNVGAYGQEVSETIREVRAFDRTTRSFVTLLGTECGFGYRDSRFKGRDHGRFVITAVTFALRRGQPPTIKYPELRRALGEGASRASLGEVRDAVLALRRAKSMLIEPGDPNARSCGSFFVNPVVSVEAARAARAGLGLTEIPEFPQPDGRIKLSAAFLIERSGFARGFQRGNVGISSRHSLALVCHDGGSSGELLAFAAEVAEGVRARTGVELQPEPAVW